MNEAIRNKPTTCGKLLLLHLSSRNDCNVTHDPLPLNWARGKLWGSVPCFGHVQTYRFAVKPATYTAPRAKSSIIFNVNHPSKWNNFRALIWRLQLLVSPHKTKPCHQMMPAPSLPVPNLSGAGKRAQALAPEAPRCDHLFSLAKSRCVIFNVFEATGTRIAFPEAKTQHWGHIELPFEVPKIVDEHRCMWKTLWILVLHAWRTPFKNSAIATYSFQTKHMLMEAVPHGISQHANVCWRLHSPCKMSVAGPQKDDLFGSSCPPWPSNPSCFRLLSCSGFSWLAWWPRPKWQGALKLPHWATPRNSCLNDCKLKKNHHHGPLSFITDKHNTHKWRILFLNTGRAGRDGKSLNQSMATNWILWRSFMNLTAMFKVDSITVELFSQDFIHHHLSLSDSPIIVRTWLQRFPKESEPCHASYTNHN